MPYKTINNTRTPKKNRPKRTITKRNKRNFLKSFLITTVSSLAIALLVMTAWNRTVAAPPPPPPLGYRPAPPMAEGTPSPNAGPAEDEDEQDPDVYWPAPARFTDDDRREMFWTFLIIGLNEGRNANTVMVASYCGITREANLVSIPRDIAINSNRRGAAQKLASSYLAGAGGGRGRAGGIAQVQRDVMNVVGFIPDYYVLIDYDTFFTIIDAVGGVEIYVPIRMMYTDIYQDLFIDLQPGLQHMDSETALLFSRFRQGDDGFPSMPGGDIGRTRNQQVVINAVIDSLLSPGNIFRIREFVDIFNESVYTNLTFMDMMFFALELNHVRGADALSTTTFVPARSGGRAYQYREWLSPAAVLEIVNSTLNPFYQDIELRDLNILTGP